MTSAATKPAPAQRRRRPADGADPAAIVLDDVWLGYDIAGGRLEVLRGTCVATSPGEMVAVVGRSGSGKSTLLHVAGGMATPTRGRVVVGQRDVTAMTAHERAVWRRRHVGFVFQSFQLLAGLSVVENVALPLVLDGQSRTGALNTANAMIDAVGLADRRAHRPAELSGGEQQRAAVARALVTRPQVVLADEPTGNLDAASAAGVLDLFVELVRRAGTACLLVTHDATIAARADRVLTMDDGRLS